MPNPAALEDSTFHSLELSLLRAWPRQSWAERRLLLAISGGADSVALTRAMMRVSHHPHLVEIAHYNHGWRGMESEQDEEFVRKLGEEVGARVHVARASDSGSRTALRSEEAARAARYQYLTSVAYSIGARHVLTAHTASDRVETMLHNLFRGTGIPGVRGVKLTRNLDDELLLVRPLLHVTRSEIEAYLRALRQPYCEDSSNTDPSYRRNYLRHWLLPSIRRKYDAGVDERLLAFSNIVSDFDEMLCSMAEEYWSHVEKLSQREFQPGELSTGAVAFPVNQVLPTHWPVVHQALRVAWGAEQWPLGKMKRTHWDSIRRLHQVTSRTTDASGSQDWRAHENLPGDLRLGTSGAWIVITADRHPKRALTP